MLYAILIAVLSCIGITAKYNGMYRADIESFSFTLLLSEVFYDCI